jgi:hypothetical protein
MMKNKIILLVLALAVACEGQYQFSQQGSNKYDVESFENNYWAQAASPLRRQIGGYQKLSQNRYPAKVVRLSATNVSTTPEQEVKTYYPPSLSTYLESKKNTANNRTVDSKENDTRISDDHNKYDTHNNDTNKKYDNEVHSNEYPGTYLGKSKTDTYSNTRVEEDRNEDIKIDNNKYESEPYRPTYRASMRDRQDDREAYRSSYRLKEADEERKDDRADERSAKNVYQQRPLERPYLDSKISVTDDEVSHEDARNASYDDIYTALQKFLKDILECIQSIDLKKYLKPKKSDYYFL